MSESLTVSSRVTSRYTQIKSRLQFNWSECVLLWNLLGPLTTGIASLSEGLEVQEVKLQV